MKTLDTSTMDAPTPVLADAEKLEMEAMSYLRTHKLSIQVLNPQHQDYEYHIQRVTRMHTRLAHSRGEGEWIKKYLRPGTVFDHIGYPAMVISSQLVKPPEMEMAPRYWAVTVHIASMEGIMEREYSVPTLAAMLVPEA